MLLLGFSRLESEPEKCAAGDVPVVKNQLGCCSEYWYCEFGKGSIIVSRPALEEFIEPKADGDWVSSEGVTGCRL